MSRRFELTDDEWERPAPLLPAMTPSGAAAGGTTARSSTASCSGPAPASRGGTCPSATDLGDGVQAVRALADQRHLGPHPGRLADPGRRGWGAGLGRPDRLDRGARPPARRWCPQGGLRSIQASRQQALGRSRGGLTTKLHTVCDGRGRNLATRLTPGQDADTSQLLGLVDQVRVARPGGRGRPRTRVAHLTADKAYSSRASRAALRARCIPHTIPERGDQKANRARRGARGGRPPAFDRQRYKQRNRVERLMNRRQQFRAVATPFDKLPSATRPRSVWPTSSSGYAPDLTSPEAIRETRLSPDGRSGAGTGPIRQWLQRIGSWAAVGNAARRLLGRERRGQPRPGIHGVSHPPKVGISSSIMPGS
jgi:transposase